MTVTVTWQAALETGDVSEFDASVVLDTGTVTPPGPAVSTTTVTTNATARTTAKKTGTHSLRLGGTVTAVQETADPIMAFWINPAGGSAGAVTRGLIRLAGHRELQSLDGSRTNTSHGA